MNQHPCVEIIFLASKSYKGKDISNVYPNYKKNLNYIYIGMDDIEENLFSIDLLFLALPHGKSAYYVQKARGKNVKVIDLGADFRLDSKELYEEWYGEKHSVPELLEESVYGLVELKKEEIKKTSIIASPGCYPTATILALNPLLKNNLIDTDTIIVDAKSGISGAGRGSNISNLFSECNENIKAYGVAGHRHISEIEQELSKIAKEKIKITFTPHLVPMMRGILSVSYARLKKEITEVELLDLYRTNYKNNYFIRILESLPETKHVKNSNFCDISVRIDKRTNMVIVISAIDNLIKGAAGQGVQGMNVLYGLEENLGIEFISMYV